MRNLYGDMGLSDSIRVTGLSALGPLHDALATSPVL
jgi:hypothetical protein